jgi:16S rRNA C967 or C1407 C5-methylase (RsmB/RsmF family)/NOL1/NOP2/fmu family ribosome biogenesis protein
MVNLPLPDSFVARVKSQLPDAQQLIELLDGEPLVSIRCNPQKSKYSKIPWAGEQVPWNREGLFLPMRPKFGQDPMYHAGLYYPMEASSMFLGYMLSQIELEDDSLILDLCAAPGGKSLILKDSFPKQLLVSNEVDRKRVHVLKENAIRWGTENHIVISSDASKLKSSGLQFDLVLVDAPCSGEGLFRKEKKSRSEWTEEKASGCALRQQIILKDTIELVKPGGYLIYSTCTFNPEENIEQIKWLRKNGFESISLQFEQNLGIETFIDSGIVGYQFWPHRTSGEGFFISLLKKQDSEHSVTQISKRPKTTPFNFLPELNFNHLIVEKFDELFFASTEAEWAMSQLLSKTGHLLRKGLYLGEQKGNDFIPSYDLAMNLRSMDFKSKLDLDETEALKYLRGEALNSPIKPGIILITYRDLPLGFGKSNGARVNNLLPKHLRIA